MMPEPISLIEQFSIPDEGTIVILDDDGELFKKLTLSAPFKVTLQRRIVGSKVDMIIIRIKDRADYKQLFERLKKALKPNGTFWIALPRENITTNAIVLEQKYIMIESAIKANLVEGSTIELNEDEQFIQFLSKAKKN